MIVHDCVYGRFELPEYVAPLLYSPEFQRLKSIRLANIDSPTFAALSDASRYSHTIGALYLASSSPLIEYSPAELKAFFAALIFHDAGSPAFGHLVEYRLKERFGFNHENILVNYLHGTHHPDTTSHVVAGIGTIRFGNICRKVGVDEQLLESILSGIHPLSKLIFGSLDFDNIDNVVRMAFLLGLNPPVESFVELARNLRVGSCGLLLSRDFYQNVVEWAKYRRASYQILVYDKVAIARQAVVTTAVELCIEDGVLGIHDWDTGERDLLIRLEGSARAKRLLRRYYHERPPALALHLEVSDAATLDGMPSASVVRSMLDEVLSEHFPTRIRFGYVFNDNGTFEKQVGFLSPDTGDRWEVGVRSRSMIVDGFVSGAAPSDHAVRTASDALRRRLA